MSLSCLQSARDVLRFELELELAFSAVCLHLRLRLFLNKLHSQKHVPMLGVMSTVLSHVC